MKRAITQYSWFFLFFCIFSCFFLIPDAQKFIYWRFYLRILSEAKEHIGQVFHRLSLFLAYFRVFVSHMNCICITFHRISLFIAHPLPICVAFKTKKPTGLGTPPPQKNGIFWEFFPSGGPPPLPPFWEPLFPKKKCGLFCISGHLEHFWSSQKCSLFGNYSDI